MDANRDPLTYAIIGLAMKVHRALGPGLFEAVYEAALAVELIEAGYDVARQVALPVYYRGHLLAEHGYRIDLLVDGRLIIELKAIRELLPTHKAQVLTYMRLAEVERGLLINFNHATLHQGIKRFRMSDFSV